MTLIACTMMSASINLFSHTPGTYFTQQEWNEWVSAPKNENDLLILKDGTSLQGTITTLPIASINGNSIQFRPDQLSLISTATHKNAPKIQWMTTSGYSYITALPNDSIVLKGHESGSYTKIPLNLVESVIFHNPSTTNERILSTVELTNGDSFPVFVVSKSVQSGRGTLYPNEFYDVSFDEGLHGTLKTDGKFKFIPHTSITESSFSAKIPSVDNVVSLNWSDVQRIQSEGNGFIDKKRLVCHSDACEELTPGLYSLNYVEQDDNEETEHWAALDPILAGAFVVSPDTFRPLSAKEQAARQLAETRELFEKIYIAQLYEELQLMNDYDELVTALTHQENKKIAQEQAAQQQHDHDYNEIMVAFSYNHDYDRMVEHLSYKQFLSDYDELMDAMAMQDVDPKTFDIRFSDTNVIDEDTPVESEKIEFAKLSPEQQSALQEQMEHGELAEVSKILGHGTGSGDDSVDKGETR